MQQELLRVKGSHLSIPRGIIILFMVDCALGALYVIDHVAGSPVRYFEAFVDLNKEGNLPTWYSSVKWFLAASLLGAAAYINPSKQKGSLAIFLMLPVVFVLFSLDEVAELHEYAGYLSDALLPDGTRDSTMFSTTGIWMFIVGLPFIVLFLLLVRSIRKWFVDVPGSLLKIVGGVGVCLAGAIGVESLVNFVIDDKYLLAAQIATEEMLEIIGGTIVVWGCYEYLKSCLSLNAYQVS